MQGQPVLKTMQGGINGRAAAVQQIVSICMCEEHQAVMLLAQADWKIDVAITIFLRHLFLPLGAKRAIYKGYPLEMGHQAVIA